jgi:hypothetical protein
LRRIEIIEIIMKLHKYLTAIANCCQPSSNSFSEFLSF